MSPLHRDKYFVKLFIGFRSSVSRLYKLYYTWYEFFIIFLALMRGWNNNLIFFFFQYKNNAGMGLSKRRHINLV